MGEFHSAVNRIPVLRRAAARLVDGGRLPAALFTDHEAAGHDRLHPRRWSGTIDLRMTLMTPLVLGEQDASPDGRQAGTVRLPRDTSGGVVVPPTMVKGMLSRAYEALTASRFRALQPRADRLTYRSDAADSLRLVPLRVTRVNEDGSLEAELLAGSSTQTVSHDGKRIPVMRAAAMQTGYKGSATLVLDGRGRRLTAMTHHGKQLRCHLALYVHGSGRYAFWHVTHLGVGEAEPEEAFTVGGESAIPKYMNEYDVTGYVYRTASDQDAEQPWLLYEKKRYERVFFTTEKEPLTVTITPEVARGYTIVANSYREQREEEERRQVRAGRTQRANRVTEKALAGKEAGHPGLAEGDLAYALLGEESYREDNTLIRGVAHKVVQLVPTMIGRRAYDFSPQDLGRAQGVLPLASRCEASAADRLFGYVVQDAPEGAVGGDVAARGRVAVGVVDTSQAQVTRGRGELLAPLLSPKPASARRFLTDSETGRTPADGGRPLPRPRLFFIPGQYLGLAAYPVHRGVLGRKGLPREATSVPPQEGLDVPADTVRLRVRDWLETGSVLTCRLRVDDVEPEELAALLWLLDPRNLVPASERTGQAVGFMRMGLGKPLGLGVVKVEVPEGGVRVHTGQALADGYRSLEGCLGVVPTTPPPTLSDGVLDVLDRRPWVRAMQRAAYGYTDGVPVRYMSLKENRANNQTEEGRPKKGRGQSPTPLADPPRPLSIENPARRQGRQVPGPPQRRGGYGGRGGHGGRRW
ncbi:hypothetical protein [Actinomyces sp. HMT897]|uniref:hypothetical protein n=1 Tax=Actinomyces sp. HMT897 TaxID=2789424 RepID=UPI00190D8C5D|nr:hypothetical protein [Actinomyces sp. HMT897]QQO77258.1 hypothetical protein JJJ15_09365 [Actinomyces sp. HMT897]